MSYLPKIRQVIDELSTQFTSDGYVPNDVIHRHINNLYRLTVNKDSFSSSAQTYMNSIHDSMATTCYMDKIDLLKTYVDMQLKDFNSECDICDEHDVSLLQLEKAHDEITRLRAANVVANEQLSKEKSAHLSSVNALQRDFSDISKKHQESLAKSKNLQDKLNEKVHEYEDMRDQCVTLRDKLVEKTSEFEETQRRSEGRLDQLRETRRMMVLLQNELTEKTSEYESLKHKFNELNETEAHLQNKFKNQINVSDSLKKQLDDFDGKIELAHEENAILGDRCDKLTTDSNELGQIYIWLARNGFGGMSAIDAIATLKK